MLLLGDVAYPEVGKGTPLNQERFRPRICGMETNETIQGGNGFSTVEPCSPKIGSIVTSNAAPISKSQAGVSSEHMKHLTASTDPESFFIEPASPRQEARKMASDVICLLLIWMSDGRTLEDRGLRASVALYCIRPDLIDGMTLDGIGVLAGCSRQAVHKLATAFRQTTGLQP